MKTRIVKVHPANPEFESIVEAANVIREGGLVIFPTETVYGIAADFNNPIAMKRLREVKRRNDSKPFSILISHKGIIENYTGYNDPRLYKLIDEYWPGLLAGRQDQRHTGRQRSERGGANGTATRSVPDACFVRSVKSKWPP